MGIYRRSTKSAPPSQGVDIMIAFNYSNDAHVAFARNASLLMEKDYWYLKEGLKIDIIVGDDLYEVNIPEGYLTDGASVPRILWTLNPKWDNSHKAVILHDYLCEYGVVTINGSTTTIDREKTDKLFLQALEFEGISKLRYTIMHAAVRLNANLLGHHLPRVNKLKRQLEDEIRINLKEKYYN